jgi:transposase
MARPATGSEHVEAARALLRSAKTADELRTAQAVLLPLELGLSLEQTASAIGRSRTATCLIRTRYCAVARGERPPARSKHTLRNHAKATLAQEEQLLDEVMHEASEGGVLVIPRLKPLMEERLGKSLALSSVYRLLARHGWRKLAPDTQHPQGDPVRREDWKKNSPTRWQKR